MSVVFVIFVLGMGAQAATLRVPSEYLTIQSALDAIEARDTVLVDTGIYVEALTAPPLSFCLIGSVSGPQIVRTTIDPTALDSPTVRTCLRLQAGTAKIERIVFRNGAAMYPHDITRPGGIWHAAERLELKECTFDSTFRSIQGPTHGATDLNNCRLNHCSGATVLTTDAPVFAANCFFECDSTDWGNFWCGGNSRFERCEFTGGHWYNNDLFLNGDTIIVRDCLFNITRPGIGSMIAVGANYTVIEGNSFIRSQRNLSVIGIMARCPGVTEIRGNFFSIIEPNIGGHGGSFLNLSSPVDGCETGFDIRDNVITNCTSFGAPHAQIGSSRTISIHHNRFAHLEPATSPVLKFHFVWPVLRNNIFEDTGMGIKLDSLSPGEADALFNWWGDSTGPYHPALNPAGLGVAVGDRVLFDPWHRDTLFLQSAPERDPIIPADDHLEIFPNPFNHETRIRLTVFNPTDVRIDILNLLGQRVFPLFTGIVMHSRDFAFNGDDLPSGIYFVRAADTITDSQIAMAKLVLLK